MGFLSYLFGKKESGVPVAEERKSYFDTEIWQEVRETYGLTEEPYPACPIDSKREVMWVQSETLYFAPRKMTSLSQIEAYGIDTIKNFHINPREHNEIRLNLHSSYQPQGNGSPLKFRSNSLKHFQTLLPDKEHKFSQKTMDLGRQNPHSTSVKIGNLRDVKSGGEFEEYLTSLFTALGYKAENTKISGDQGIDVLVIKDKKKYGIQAKYYSQPVGNSAVQEVIAGREYFKLNKGIVITNSTFTKSARQLAEKTNVRLIDGEELNDIIQRAKSGKIVDIG